MHVKIRIDNGETKKAIAEDYEVTVRTLLLWLRVAYGPKKKNEDVTMKVYGMFFERHSNRCQVFDCGLDAEAPRKTGFKDGSPIGQWKAYCQTHGFVYYNLERKK